MPPSTLYSSCNALQPSTADASASQSPPLMFMPCRDAACQASISICNTCSKLHVTPSPANMTPQTVLLRRVSTLIEKLNMAPAAALPRWVIQTAAWTTAQHGATGLDDGENLAGSALMLIMLRPLLFGDPSKAPLRIFGAPPPKVLLDLDGPVDDSAVCRDWTNDINRALCVKGLLEHFDGEGDVDRFSALQGCLDLMKQIIEHKEWYDLEACRIARQSLLFED